MKISIIKIKNKNKYLISFLTFININDELIKKKIYNYIRILNRKIKYFKYLKF